MSPTEVQPQTAPLRGEMTTGGGTMAAALACGALAIFGLSTIASSVLALWTLWTTDALKSIGMIVPVVSFLLVLRVWRRLGWGRTGWALQGSWWGFGLLMLLAAAVRLRDQTILLLILAPQWSMFFPPHSLVLYLYGVGVVWLFGGSRLVRASRFPLGLLLLANPVPHVFNVWVDLPLQRASAHVARGFAMALGQPLSPDRLHLMFTPTFGMFIAPGCNGIRGAVTMGFIALVAGYLYRFRWQTHAAVVLAALALGYLFNLIRLCALVLYYLVALHRPWLQDRAEDGDYLIGACLFFVAVFLLYTAIERLGGSPRSVQPPLAGDAFEPSEPRVPRSFYARAAAMTFLAAAGCVLVQRSLHHARYARQANAPASFAQTAGSYTLLRTWDETLPGGALLFHWAEYAPASAPGTHIAVGLSPVLGSHDTLVCHSARGEDPLWHGQTAFPTRTAPVSFSTALFNDGATQSLEATTLCNGTRCGEYATPPARMGFVWSMPHPAALLNADPERPIPILLKAETIDTTLSIDAARRQLSANVADFLVGSDLESMTAPYRSH